jgi:hypothetical protein
MTKEQWINSISNEELAFRMYGKGYFLRTCPDCVFFKQDEYGAYRCASKQHEPECREQFEEWLEEDMDD